MEVDDSTTNVNEKNSVAFGDPDQWTPLDDLPRPFDSVSSDLVALGALSVEEFLSNATSSSAVFDVAFYVQLPEPPALSEKEKGENKQTNEANGNDGKDNKVNELQKESQKLVATLHDASHRMFGSSDCLKFDFVEENPKNKQCILTITRPNGAARSYKSDPNAGYTRRHDARAQAAKIAIEMGAIDFILSGDSDALKAKKGMLLNPLDVEIDNETSEIAPGMSKYTEKEEPLKLIEETCIAWRGGKVRPHWVTYTDTKDKKKNGAALRISLNAHVFRVYSVDPTYEYPKLAKIACARSALEEGVIDFIKHGNGQAIPPKVVYADPEDTLTTTHQDPIPVPHSKGITLQDFFEALPQPFPENVGDTANDINAPAWLNHALQSARGGKLISSFTAIMDGHVHGCILRIQSPTNTKTYLVDPQFSKRADAKPAVCLLAMSQGVGDYIRGLKEEAENKLPADRRKLANEKLLQVLAAECTKVKQGNRLKYDYTTERDAFGCALKVDISPSADPDVREYIVDAEYRTKADAKAAVACLAAEQGLVDLLRFRGEPLPEDYVPFWEAQVNGAGDNYIAKRKGPDRDVEGDGHDRKKRRKGDGKDNAPEAGGAITMPRAKVKVELPPDAGLPRKPAPYVPSQPLNGTKNSWKKPRATGSSGLGSTNAYASASRSGGQDRSGNRNGGPPHSLSHRPPPRLHSAMNGYSNTSSSSLPSSYGPQSRSYDEHRTYGPGPAYQSEPQSTPESSYARPDHYSHPDNYSRPDPHSRSGSYLRPEYSQPHAYPDVYGHHNAYPPPDPYAQTDSYGSSYPPYPSPVGDHYAGHSYHTSPPPPHHYPPYHTAAPILHPPPPPPHAAYGQYHPAQYPPPYPNGPYTGHYGPPHHAGHYSSPPPLPPIPMAPYPHINHAPPSPYPPRFRSPYSPPYSPHSQYPPLPPQSPPHSLPRTSDYSSYEHHPPTNHRRRHTSHAESQPQLNGYHNYQRENVRERHRDGHPPSENNRPGHPRASASISSRPSPHIAQGHDDVPIKQESIDTPTPSTPPSAPEPQKAPPPNSNLAALYDFCQKENFARPKFVFEVVADKDGEKKFKVWAEKTSQRFELPTLFSNFAEGRERLAKRVLDWEILRLEQK